MIIDYPTQIAAVHAEVCHRRRVLPCAVRAGQLTQDEADERIAVMEAVEATLVDALMHTHQEPRNEGP
jgi:hypothetical protein